MRFSDIRGERALDVVADCIGPLTNIVEDEEIMALLKPEEAPKGMTPREFFFKRVRTAVPALVKSHSEDIIAVLAAINGTTPEEYAENLTPVGLVSDVYELLTDKVSPVFLDSRQESKPGAPSGAASARTKARKG